MRRYINWNLRHIIVTWLLLTFEILVVAILYAYLNFVGLSKIYVYSISSIFAVALVTFDSTITYKITSKRKERLLNAPQISRGDTMVTTLRSLWQKIKQHRVAIAVVAIVLVVVIALIIVGYRFDWTWTGFNGYIKPTITNTISGTNAGTVTKTEEFQPGKTLWDWLQLLGVLAIPVVVGFGAVWFTTRQGKVADAENKDNQRETALQAYIDKMSELLLKEHLDERTTDGKLKPEYEHVRNVARVRTITLLTQLDVRRIGYVFAFLREAELMSVTKDDNVISLKNADLHAVDWSQADLRGADLRGANLSGANLSGAIFFSIIYVPRAFGGTIVIPNHADLSGADLSGADLRGAKVTDEQLAKAASIEGATMPDGTIHE
jgi:hypothetical protein